MRVHAAAGWVLLETKNEISAIRSKGEDRWGTNELRGFGIGRGHCK